MNEAEITYIKQWIFKANEDISVVQALVDLDIESYTGTICFHCH